MPIYWALLTYSLLRPSIEEAQGWFLFPHVDKFFHFVFFLILGALLKFSYPNMRFYLFILLLLGYAILTEILQDMLNTGRTGDVYDLIADAIGILAGFWIGKKALRKVSSNVHGNDGID